MSHTAQALTPNEWANKTYVGNDGGMRLTAGDANRPDGCLDIRLRSINAVTIEHLLRPHDRHALRALALYGQAFGFAREMANALQRCIEVFAKYGWSDLQGGAEILATANAALDRIAALLPPGQTTGSP
jgi:hypothetical protein